MTGEAGKTAEEVENGKATAAEEENADKENGEKTNGHSEAAAAAEEPQPGPSGIVDNESSNDAQETDNEEPDDGGNLELAWEVLLNAASIFERQDGEGLKNLMEVYIELAGISLENGNFEASMKDFTRALDVFQDLDGDDQNPRIAAEVHYKIGLCQMMEKLYGKSVESFQTAADLIADVITNEKARTEQTEDVLATIKDLEETQQEILVKITEIGETKSGEEELVKREMLKMFGPLTGVSDGAGTSSSSSGSGSGAATTAATKSLKSPEADKPKPSDISHLVKRKKPDTDSAIEGSPAKKKAVETSPGEKIAVAVEKAVEEESTAVPVIEN